MKTTLLRIGLVLAMMVSLFTTKVKAFTAVASGDWSSAATWGGIAPGPSVSNQDIIIPAGITVNLDMDVSFSGLLNTFSVDGTLSTASAYGVSVAQGSFAGNGTVDIHSLEFTSLFATIPFTGNLTLNRLRNAGASLALTAVASVSDTLDLESGSLSVNAGGNITPQASSTIKVNNGSITINGGVFNSGNTYNVLYVGTSKSSGVELNSTSLNHVYLNMDSNTETVSLSSDLLVNGTLYLDQGTLDFAGDELTLSGNVVVVAGAMLDSDAGSNLVVQGTTTLTSGLTFNAGASLNDFTINYGGAGNVRLLSGLSIAGGLWLMDGNLALENGSTLTMNLNSGIHVQDGAMLANGGSFVGTAAYDVEYTGSSNTSGIELSGSGLTDVGLNLTSSSAQIAMGSDVAVEGVFALSNGKWNLNGNDLTLNGTIDQGATATFVGNSNSHLNLSLAATSNDILIFDNSNQTLNRFTLDLAGASSIMLGSGLSLVSELVLTNGKLDIGNYDLVLQSAAAISGSSDANYIVTSGTGRLQMNVNAAAPYVTFPIGTSSNYSPAMIQQTTLGTSGNFMVKAMNGFYAQGTSGTNFAATESVVDRTWFIESAVGMTVNMNLKLGWMAAAEVNGFDRAQSYISHYMNTTWDAYAAGSATVGANNTYELTRNGITALSPFAVADTSVVLSLPDNVVANEVFQAYPNPVRNVMYIAFADPNKGYEYAVMDLMGKTVLHGTGQSGTHTLDVSMLSSGCYLLKATHLGNDQATVKRFIKD